MFEKYLTVAMHAAMRAGDILRRGYRTEFAVKSKGQLHNLVTEYDRSAEREIISFIQQDFSGDSILAEEGGFHKGGEVMWIIDPLDGTCNFSRHLPIFATSIAVAVQQEVVAGVVYVPMLGEMFTAMRGKGAWLNGHKIAVSKRSLLEEAVIATGLPPNCSENPRHCIDDLVRMAKKGCPIRRMGSACIDLAYVACGRFDAFWEATLQSWDYAAGKLLIEEAGGIVSAYRGSQMDVREESSVIASNGHLHGQLLSEIE